MKVTFSLNYHVKALDGQDMMMSADGKLSPLNAGKFLASILGQKTTGDYLKYTSWAETLYAGKDLELDESDMKTFEAVVTDDSAGISAIIKASIMRAVNAAKEKAAKKK